MRCNRCGHELDENGSCSFCENRGSNVSVLSEEERYTYEGITIDESEDFEEQRAYSKRKDGIRNGVYYRQFHLGGQKGWLSWIIGGIAVLSILACVFFFVMPLLLVLGGVIILSWFIYRLFH